MPKHLFEGDVFLMKTFNAIPFPTLVVDNDVHFLFWNSASLSLLGKEKVYQRRCGEVLHCIHLMETKDGCGHAPRCKTCVVRISVNEAIHGGKVYRQKSIMEITSDEKITEVPLLVTTSPYAYKRKKTCLAYSGKYTRVDATWQYSSHMRKMQKDTNGRQPMGTSRKIY